MYHQKNVDYVELLWEDFIYHIDNKAYKKQEKMYYPRFTKVIIHYFLTQDKTISWRYKIRMHTSKDDYLINTLRFVSAKEETQIYGAILPKSLTSPEMKETQAYKTYLRKSNRVKRPTKKSIEAPARGVVIRETLEMPLTKKKEKVDVTRGKGIELLSRVALTEDAQFEEVQRKSMRDFHKTHPSGSGTVTKTAPSVAKIKSSVSNERTSVKPGVSDVTKEESFENNENESDSEHETDESESGSESDHEENKEDEDYKEEVKDEFVKTPSNGFDNEDETKITDGDEDEEIDYTTSQLYNDVDIRLNEPVDTDKGLFKRRTEVLVTSSSHSSDLAAKFLNFLDIPHRYAEIVSPMDVHVHHEMVKELHEDAVPAKESSQPQSSYEAAATVIEFELKKILIDKMDKMYSLKRNQKDNDEDPSAGSDRGLKKRKTSKDAKPAKGPKAKES
nr:hypothetical protein [Tanacetum cinerariifolium]